MDGIDLHAGHARQHRRITICQIDSADRLGLVRGEAIDERNQAAADLGLFGCGGNRFGIDGQYRTRASAIPDRVAEDAVEPGIDTFRVLELVEVPGSSQQGILEDVVSGVRICHPSANEGPEAVQIGQQPFLGLALGRCCHGVGPGRCAS